MKALREYAIEEFDTMPTVELRALCDEQWIDVKGKANRIAALRTAWQQSDGTYHTSISRCRYCASEVYVDGRHTEPLTPTQHYLVRHIRCKGPKRHRYTLKQIIQG